MRRGSLDEGYGSDMTSEPPWEWVDGDPVRVAHFELLRGMFIGAVSTMLVLWILIFVGVTASLPLISIGPAVSQIYLWSVLAAEGLFLILAFYIVPRRIPIIGRLGISPIGLWFAPGFRGSMVLWDQVHGVGPDWVEISAGLGPQRFKLTATQEHRVLEFLQPAERWWTSPIVARTAPDHR
jgi:hypothetical protein